MTSVRTATARSQPPSRRRSENPQRTTKAPKGATTARTAERRRAELTVHDQVRMSPRLWAVAVTVFVVVVVLSSLFVQSELIAGQQRLNEINADIRSEEYRSRVLRQAEAEAEAPQQIMSQAETMGLVKAESAVPLLPPSENP